MADRFQTPIDLPVLSSDPTNPPAGYIRWYSKTDGKSYQRDPAGVVTELTNGTYESPLTFNNGLSRVGDTVANTLFTGNSTGQTVNGGTLTGGTLTLSSTAHATKGLIQFGNSAYDEVNNRLGIGTTSPAYKLDVNDKIYSASRFVSRFGLSSSELYNTRQTKQIYGFFGGVTPGVDNTFGDLYGIGYSYGTLGGAAFADQHNIVITSGGTVKATIGTNNGDLDIQGKALITGNVGIGNTSPSEKLHVTGSAKITTGDIALDNNRSVAWGGGGEYITGSQSANSVSLFTNTINRLHVNSSGYIGIGTSSPATLLETKAASANNTLTITTSGGSSFIPKLSFNRLGDSSWNLYQPSGAYDFTIDQDGTRKVTIQSNTGNVGVGVNIPKAKMHIIAGTAGIGSTPTGTVLALERSGDGENAYLYTAAGYNASAGLIFTDASGGDKGKILYSNSAESFGIHTDGTEKVSILSDGKVGIGTASPVNLLSLYGSNPLIHFSRGDSYYWQTGVGDGSSTDIPTSFWGIRDASFSTARLVIAHTTGYVGIGNTSPATKLDVNGTGNFAGDVTVPDEAYGAGWNGSLEVPTKNAIYDKIETISTTSILQAVYPVGSIYISVVSTNPATLFGFGTWAAFAAGRTLVGIDTGQSEFDSVEETGGAKTHTLTEAEMPAHTHSIRLNGAGTSTSSTGIYNSGNTAGAPERAGNLPTGSTGSGSAHNNLQPYIVTYMWKRTA